MTGWYCSPEPVARQQVMAGVPGRARLQNCSWPGNRKRKRPKPYNPLQRQGPITRDLLLGCTMKRFQHLPIDHTREQPWTHLP